MDSRVKELALAIMAKAMDAGPENRADVFVSWAPHVAWLGVEIYPDGWVDSREPGYIEPERRTVSLYPSSGIQAALQSLSEILLRVHEVAEAGKP